MAQEASVNSDARSAMEIIEGRVARTQVKYHRWAKTDRTARFGDLFNLVCHPVHLLVAWEHVAHNKGARTAGIDGVTVRQISESGQVGAFLAGIASALKDGTYRPSPVRRVLIPKPGGKSRPLGIPTVTDRVVQQSLRMVLEPIFEADFLPVSYGFRPRRRAHDAVAEIHYYASRGYRWVLDADIKGCFDNIDHQVILDRVRARISDKKTVALVRAFLKAGVMTDLGLERAGEAGTPQGGIISPLLANIALSVLDEAIMAPWAEGGEQSTQWARRRRVLQGLGNWRIVRYADDFVIMTNGTADDAAALQEASTSGAGRARTGVLRGQDPHHPPERGDRLPRLPHPVAATTRKRQVVLHDLHRGEVVREDQADHPQPDPSPVPSPTDGGDHRGQRGTARLDVLLPPRDRRATFLLPQVLHLETDRGLATRAAPLELDQGQTMAPTPRWELENHRDPGCCALRSDPRSYRALLVSRHPHPQPLRPDHHQLNGITLVESPLR